MGWASGSGLAEDVWTTIREIVPEKKRQQIARKIVDAFESYDCDTIQEAEQLWDDCKFKECEDCGTRLEDKSKPTMCEYCTEEELERKQNE